MTPPKGPRSKRARGIWKGSYVEPWLYRVCTRGGHRSALRMPNAHP